MNSFSLLLLLSKSLLRRLVLLLVLVLVLVLLLLLLLLRLLFFFTSPNENRLEYATRAAGRARRRDSQGHGEIPNDNRRAIRLGACLVQLYKNKIKMNLFSLLLLLSKSLLRRLVLFLVLVLLLLLLLVLLLLLLLPLHITEREQARVRNAGGRAGPTSRLSGSRGDPERQQTGHTSWRVSCAAVQK